MDTFLESCIRQLLKKRREGGRAGFSKRMKGTAVQGRRSVTSQNIEEKDGKVL